MQADKRSAQNHDLGPPPELTQRPSFGSEQFKELFDHVSKSACRDGVQGMERSNFVRGSNNTGGKSGKVRRALRVVEPDPL